MISLSTLDLNGYAYKVKNRELRVTSGCLMVMKALKHNSFFNLQGSTVI